MAFLPQQPPGAPPGAMRNSLARYPANPQTAGVGGAPVSQPGMSTGQNNAQPYSPANDPYAGLGADAWHSLYPNGIQPGALGGGYAPGTAMGPGPINPAMPAPSRPPTAGGGYATDRFNRGGQGFNSGAPMAPPAPGLRAPVVGASADPGFDAKAYWTPERIAQANANGAPGGTGSGQPIDIAAAPASVRDQRMMAQAARQQGRAGAMPPPPKGGQPGAQAMPY